jgi:hypothetical protein
MMITTVSMSPQNPCLDLTAFVAVWMYGPLKKRLGHKGSALVNGLLSLSLKWDSDKMVSLPGFLPFHPAMMQHKALSKGCHSGPGLSESRNVNQINIFSYKLFSLWLSVAAEEN